MDFWLPIAKVFLVRYPTELVAEIFPSSCPPRLKSSVLIPLQSVGKDPSLGVSLSATVGTGTDTGCVPCVEVE